MPVFPGLKHKKKHDLPASPIGSSWHEGCKIPAGSRVATHEDSPVNVTEFLRSERGALLERWKDLIVQDYPEESAGFLRRQRDRFRNPVGHAIETGVDSIFDNIVSGRSAADSRDPLEEIIKIRAVQDLSPARAVGFVHLLKRAVLENGGELFSDGNNWEELLALYERIDQLTLLAFEIHAHCREKIYDIRTIEIKRRTAKLQEFVDRCYGTPDESGVKGGSGA